MKFKTVKEFFEVLCSLDYSFVKENDEDADYACFKVSTNMIEVFTHNSSSSPIYSDPIDTIYGYFHCDGGRVDLSCENYWSLEFEITDEDLLVGTTYKIKVPYCSPKKQPSIIEL